MVTIEKIFPQNHFPLSHAESCPGFIFSSPITSIVNDMNILSLIREFYTLENMFYF